MIHQPYEETTLAAILEGFGSIDRQDPYQVYCLFMLIDAECVRCGATIDFAELTSEAALPEWCGQAAQLMRRSGWFVPEANDGWHFIEAYCPLCGFDPLPNTTPNDCERVKATGY